MGSFWAPWVHWPYQILKETYQILKETYPILKETHQILKETYPILKETYQILGRKIWATNRAKNMGPGTRAGTPQFCGGTRDPGRDPLVLWWDPGPGLGPLSFVVGPGTQAGTP